MEDTAPYVFGDELDKRALEIAKEYEEIKKEAQDLKNRIRRKHVSQEKPSRLKRQLISILEKLTAFLERTQ